MKVFVTAILEGAIADGKASVAAEKEKNGELEMENAMVVVKYHEVVAVGGTSHHRCCRDLQNSGARMVERTRSFTRAPPLLSHGHCYMLRYRSSGLWNGAVFTEIRRCFQPRRCSSSPPELIEMPPKPRLGSSIIIPFSFHCITIEYHQSN
ncbi:hypothetical protein PIB30_083506 [Stylosanthes scabra]|uniref:Uncharacterized protein n=1 Tax=Stylosanthes scabra TaxID=79078 RepID=A0ABU6TT23_9FABA|nr:hypothetical protein [Stylosanthes scabra]